MHKYFFSTRDQVTVDVAVRDASGVLRSRINQRTLEEARAARDDESIVVIDEETLLAQQRARFIRPPQRTTREEFHRLLNELPPVGWRNSGDAESFKLAEFTYADVTTIAVRVGQEFFLLSDSVTLPHEEIVRRVIASGLRAH